MLQSKNWSARFFYSALAQGALAFIVTIYLFIYGSEYITPAPAMVIVSGSAGTWLLIGYVLYIIMIVYLAATSFFYYMLEQNTGKHGNYYGYFSLAHLVLVNIGIIGTTFLLMLAGYIGGVALLPTSEGGGGLTQMQTHVQHLSVFPPYVIVFLAIVSLGALCGGISYYLALKKK